MVKVTMRRLCLPGSLACRRRTGIEGRVMKPTGTPQVKSSAVEISDQKKILIVWDRPITATCDIKDQINVKIDGAAPIHPTSVTFQGSEMVITMAAPFDPGHTITWAYDDSGPCDLQDADGNEADNQTYAVKNNPAAGPDDWTDEHGNSWEDENANKWKDK